MPPDVKRRSVEHVLGKPQPYPCPGRYCRKATRTFFMKAARPQNLKAILRPARQAWPELGCSGCPRPRTPSPQRRKLPSQNRHNTQHTARQRRSHRAVSPLHFSMLRWPWGPWLALSRELAELRTTHMPSRTRAAHVAQPRQRAPLARKRRARATLAASSPCYPVSAVMSLA